MRELTLKAAAALERLRNGDMSHHIDDCALMMMELVRIYPRCHADEITPERLVACGGEIAESTTGTSILVDLGDNLWVLCATDRIVWILDGINIPDRASPRNMGEVWELLDRLGIDWRKKGGV